MWPVVYLGLLIGQCTKDKPSVNQSRLFTELEKKNIPNLLRLSSTTKKRHKIVTVQCAEITVFNVDL